MYNLRVRSIILNGGGLAEDISYNTLIDELSGLCGILPEYWDILGKQHIIPLDTKKAVLEAMGLKIGSELDLLHEIEERKQRPWKNMIEPVFVKLSGDEPVALPIYIPIDETAEDGLLISFSIKDENGDEDTFNLSGKEIAIAECRWIDSIRYIKVELIDMKQRDIGYYEIKVTCRHLDGIFQDGKNVLEKSSRLILTPKACYMPSGPEEGRAWGLSLNLYAVKSSGNWGIGDFNDLKKVVKWASEMGGDFIGINPLHSIPNTMPFGISPYSPISRLYKNFTYLDMEDIPEVKGLKGQGSRVKGQIDKLRKGDLIDYEKAASLKMVILRDAFELFFERHYIHDTTRAKEFKKYIKEEGEAIQSFATYMALADFFKGHSWQQWPAEYHEYSSNAVCEFRKTHEKDISFYMYLQWLISKQLKQINKLSDDSKMGIGLYHDLAIGSIGGGSDVWEYRGCMAEGADVGAPPDDFNVNGQNWGFPPLIPEKLKGSGYEFFIQILRKNMKHMGALRIDHVLGMFRLYWIPKGKPASDGAYVQYPYQDLLRIIALESVRNKTMIIGEDLGTVGENVREELKKFKMLSYKVFYFERNYPEPSFTLPEDYPEMALCTVTTHDLPTIYGWWAGRDIEVKKELSIYPDDDAYQRDIVNRQRDKELLLNALAAQGILEPSVLSPEPLKMTPELCLAIYKYLSMTPCKMLQVNLDDILGAVDQQNMPGTVDEHPNWRQKTAINLEDILSDKRFVELLEIFKI